MVKVSHGRQYIKDPYRAQWGGGVMVIVAIRRESQPDYMGKH